MKSGIISVTLVSCSLLTSGTQAAKVDEFNPRQIVSGKPEPAFDPLFYSELPTTVQMIVKTSTKDVVDAVIRKYPAAIEESVEIRVEYEFPIKSAGNYFRRISIFLADTANVGAHGTCGQPIAVWLAPNGLIKEIYVNEPTCPV